MLADELDYVIGVDPHRDTHALAVVDVRSGGVVFEATAVADGEGYASVLRLADQHAPGRRAFAVEGTGSFGAGLARFLVSQEERVLEVGRLRRERSGGGPVSSGPTFLTHHFQASVWRFLARCSASAPGRCRS